MDGKLDTIMTDVENMEYYLKFYAIPSDLAGVLANEYEEYYQVTNPGASTEEKMQFIIDYLVQHKYVRQ